MISNSQETCYCILKQLQATMRQPPSKIHQKSSIEELCLYNWTDQLAKLDEGVMWKTRSKILYIIGKIQEGKQLYNSCYYSAGIVVSVEMKINY